MDTKRLALQIKAAGPADGLQEGQFQGYASVFGNVDSYGDIVVAGAFTDTLADWAASNDGRFPLLWGHDTSDPFSNLGFATGVQDDHGLLVTGTFDLDNPKAQQVYRMTKGRRVDQMSFAYDVVDGGQETRDGDTVYLLKTLKLYEVSIVPYGANQETEILAVKANAAAIAHALKEGRVLAAKHIDSLRAAQENIAAVIAAATSIDDSEKASGQATAKDEEPDGAKSEEPGVSPSANEALESRIRYCERSLG